MSAPKDQPPRSDQAEAQHYGHNHPLTLACTGLRLQFNVVFKARDLHRRIYPMMTHLKKSPEALLAASIFSACREEEAERLLHQVCKEASADMRDTVEVLGIIEHLILDPAPRSQPPEVRYEDASWVEESCYCMDGKPKRIVLSWPDEAECELWGCYDSMMLGISTFYEMHMLGIEQKPRETWCSRAKERINEFTKDRPMNITASVFFEPNKPKSSKPKPAKKEEIPDIDEIEACESWYQVAEGDT